MSRTQDDDSDLKAHYQEMLTAIRDKRNSLPVASRVRAALTDELFTQLDRRIEGTRPRDLEFAPWPPLVSIVDHLPQTSIEELDADIDLVKNLNPDKSQCADDDPNLLLLSFAGCGVPAYNHGIGWALDELFADQPVIARRLVSASSHVTDISLGAWIEFTANELINSGRLTGDDYCDNYDRIIGAPRKLSGIVLLKNGKFSEARINYNARKICRISHAEMAEIERMFSAPPTYTI